MEGSFVYVLFERLRESRKTASLTLRRKAAKNGISYVGATLRQAQGFQQPVAHKMDYMDAMDNDIASDPDPGSAELQLGM